MGKRRTKPKSIEEAQERIRKALYQLNFGPRILPDGSFYPSVSFRDWSRWGASKEVVRAVQRDLDRKQRRLSQRVHRFYRRSGRISLVCNLLRRSPIFFRDKWVIDVIRELQIAVRTHPNRARREEALRGLKELSETICSENLPPHLPHRKTKWRRLAAKRPPRTSLTVLALLGRYGQYLEIGICLLAGKELTRRDWARDGRFPTDPETLRTYARLFGVPEGWIKTAWGPKRVRAREWALGQLGADHNCTQDGIRRRLADAEALRKAELLIVTRVLLAQRRLRKECERPGTEA
jgi:hypothetical protein